MLKEKAFSQVIPQSKSNRLFGQYIIKHAFQFKCGFFFCGTTACALFLAWVEVRLSIGHLLESAVNLNEDIVLQLSLLTGIVGKTALIMTAISFVLGLFLSHFLAGPIYRLEKTLENIRDGNLVGQVRLRDHDEFTETADLLNQVLASLRGKIKKERDATSVTMEKFAALVDGLKKSGHSAEAEQLEALVIEIKNAPPQIRIS